MSDRLYFMLAPAAGLVIGWILGARAGFRRGFSSRIAGGIPPAYTKSRQLTKAFGLGIAKQARKAHVAEIARIKKIGSGPAWRRALEKLLYPCIVAIALASSSCERITGVPPAPRCTPTYRDTIRFELDSAPRTIHSGGCK